MDKHGKQGQWTVLAGAMALALSMSGCTTRAVAPQAGGATGHEELRVVAGELPEIVVEARRFTVNRAPEADIVVTARRLPERAQDAPYLGEVEVVASRLPATPAVATLARSAAGGEGALLQ